MNKIFIKTHKNKAKRDKQDLHLCIRGAFLAYANGIAMQLEIYGRLATRPDDLLLESAIKTQLK
jgi:hypothetical protein